jgi:hypothetical protein
MSKRPQRWRKNVLFVIVAVIILLIPIGYSVVAAIAPTGGRTVQMMLERPDPQYTECAGGRDASYMRYHHWEVLTQVRDDVMRRGERSIIGLDGLNRCRECHTSREAFCNHCHDAVNLYPECFGCHYYP